MPLTFEPLALISGVAFFNAIPLDVIFEPIPFVNPAIEVVINSLPMPFPSMHLSFVSLAILMNENTLAMVPVVLPLTKIDISIVILKDASTMLLIIFELSLIGLSGCVLNLFDVRHELPVGTINILLEKGFNNTALLFDQL